MVGYNSGGSSSNRGMEGKMICYRDMTFCSFWRECAQDRHQQGACGRALTPEVEKRAKEIGLPISRFMDKPDCFEERKVNG